MGRMSTSEWIDKGFWALLVGIAALIAREASSMRSDVQELNKSMSAMVVTVGNQKERIDQFERRLQVLEQVQMSRAPAQK